MGTAKGDAIVGNNPLDLAKAIELSGLDAVERATLLGMLNFRDILENVIVNALAGQSTWADWVNVSHNADQVRSLVGPLILLGGPEADHV